MFVIVFVFIAALEDTNSALIESRLGKDVLESCNFIEYQCILESSS